MDAGLGRRTDVLVSAQALGPKWVRINRRMEAGGMIDRQASTRAEGRLEGRLRDWAGDDKCFMFVSLNMRVSQRVGGESKSEIIRQSASFCMSLSEPRDVASAHTHILKCTFTRLGRAFHFKSIRYRTTATHSLQHQRKRNLKFVTQREEKLLEHRMTKTFRFIGFAPPCI